MVITLLFMKNCMCVRMWVGLCKQFPELASSKTGKEVPFLPSTFNTWIAWNFKRKHVLVLRFTVYINISLHFHRKG